MGRNPTKAAGNRYFESRKKAAEHDERLTSREGAGDLLGVSWSSMADYERGLTRVPVDVVIRMSELYKDPALLNWFCCNEFPVAGSTPSRGTPAPWPESLKTAAASGTRATLSVPATSAAMAALITLLWRMMKTWIRTSSTKCSRRL